MDSFPDIDSDDNAANQHAQQKPVEPVAKFKARNGRRKKKVKDNSPNQPQGKRVRELNNEETREPMLDTAIGMETEVSNKFQENVVIDPALMGKPQNIQVQQPARKQLKSSDSLIADTLRHTYRTRNGVEFNGRDILAYLEHKGHNCIIGEGAHGNVYRLQLSRKLFAVKRIPSKIGTVEVKFAKQARVAKRFEHKSIVKFHGVVKYNRYVLLIMELGRGSLDRMISRLLKYNMKELCPTRKHRNGEKIACVPESVVSRIFASCVEGLIYLYKKGYYHSDIKPSNILYTNGSDYFKLTDFSVSSAKLSQELSGAQPKGFTKYYVSPQVARNPKDQSLIIHCDFDIWCLGLTLVEVARLEHPVQVMLRESNDETSSVLSWLAACDDNQTTTALPVIDGIYSHEFLNVYNKMTLANAKKRYRYLGEQDPSEPAKRTEKSYMGPREGLQDTDLFKKYCNAAVECRDNPNIRREVIQFLENMEGVIKAQSCSLGTRQ